MYELEIQRQRAAILNGLSASSKKMLSEKVKYNGLIAISKNENVQVVRVKDILLS